MNPTMANAQRNSMTMEDFRSACRLCFLREQPQLEDSLSIELLPNKIEHCLGIRISQEDYPATLVCPRCITLLNHFYDFKLLCQGNEQDFRNIAQRQTGPPMVVIKSEPLELVDHSEPELVEVKAEPACLLEPMEEHIPEESYEEIPSTSSVVEKPRKVFPFKPLEVHMIFENNRFICTRVKPCGSMQWDCSRNLCEVSYISTIEGVLSLRLPKQHDHPDHVPTVGMIYCGKSGQQERFAVDDDLQQGKPKFIWNEHDYYLERNGMEQKAICCGANCPKYLRIVGNFEQLEDFNEHNHAKSFILIRDGESLSESELNPWDLFCQVNPCQLPLAVELETPLRMKLFHNQQQYRLHDCSWDGSSQWRCDTTSCKSLLTLENDGRYIEVKKHGHEVHMERQGIFNSSYFFAMLTYSGVKKIFYNGHCYSSTTTKDSATAPWACALIKTPSVLCHAKLQIGPDYETMQLLGQHNHGGFGAIVKPWKKKAVYLPVDNPTFPPTITMDDLLQSGPQKTVKSVKIKPLVPPTPVQPKQPVVKPSGRLRNLNDDPEASGQTLRMVFEGHRYTLVEFFPDGTCFFRCWGHTCRKQLHMTPEGKIYCRKESIEHTHMPMVSLVSHVTLEGDRKEYFAIFTDIISNTMMVFRNAFWRVAPGDGCLYATCQEIVIKERRSCNAKIKIDHNYTRFEYITEKCSGHGSELQYLIRLSADPLPDDPILWQIYNEKHPFYMPDGSALTESRYSHMFVGGFRYTNQSILWGGGSLLRCAQQKCPAKGRLKTSGLFVTPTHPHDVPEHLQGTIWSVKRQRDERFFVHITLKKTMATLHYNTYSYALRDERRNIWACYPGVCNATVRIEGDFERVVDEMEHCHDGTLTIIRSDETPESEVILAPVKVGNRKRPRGKGEVEVVTDASESVSDSPKLATICQLLVKKSTRPTEPFVRSNTMLHYHAGFTYSKATVSNDGNLKLECIKYRCPGRAILTPPSHSVLSMTDHSHPKSFQSYGNIRDVETNETLLYILVNGSQMKNVTYFVCDGYRYNCTTKGSIANIHSEWTCCKCTVRVMCSDGFSTIEHSSQHDHDRADIIVPFSGMETPAATVSEPQPPTSWNLNEVIWGDHRYTTPIHIRRLNKIKWMCYRRRDCKSYVFQDPDGTFEEVERHDHEGPVQSLGEAKFDQFLKAKDRYAILKPGERPRLRMLYFQNQKYYENTDNFWVCVQKVCSGRLRADENFEFLQIVEGHCHQPVVTAIKFHAEVHSSSGPSLANQN